MQMGFAHYSKPTAVVFGQNLYSHLNTNLDFQPQPFHAWLDLRGFFDCAPERSTLSKYLLASLGCIGQALSSIVEWILARDPIHLAYLWLFAILAISFLASLVGLAHSYFGDQLYRLVAFAIFVRVLST